jgi:predicted RNA-binding Zn-ribbon protein involved in translation (DUF1610 family)
MQAGDKIWVDECPRCGFEGEFERCGDGSYFFECPECGWNVTDEDEEGEA